MTRNLLLCMLAISTQVIAQEKNNPNTFIKYHKIGDHGINRGVTVEQTADGGFILTGLAKGDNTKGEDVFLIKTNKQGEQVWAKTYGGSGNDNGWAVRQTPDGGFIVVGFTDSFGSGMQIYLIKADTQGNEQWSKTFGGADEEYGWDIRNTKDGGFIIAAQTNSAGNGEIDANLIKIDKDGNEEWSRTYGGEKIDRIFSVHQTSDGGYIAVGITYSYETVNQNDRDGYLLKVDSKGEQEWYKVFGGDGYDVTHDVSLTNDGGFILTGYGESYAANLGRDVYLIKTDRQGTVQWKKVFGGAEEERGIKGIQTKDGGYIAIGFTGNNADLYLVRADSKGEELWTRTFEGDSNFVEFGYTVQETTDGGFILIGHKEERATNSSVVLLLKTDGNGSL